MSEVYTSNSSNPKTEITPVRYYLTRPCEKCGKKTSHVFETVDDTVGRCTKCKEPEAMTHPEMRMGDETSKDNGKTQQSDKVGSVVLPEPKTEDEKQIAEVVARIDTPQATDHVHPNEPPVAPPEVEQPIPLDVAPASGPLERIGERQLRHERVLCYTASLDALKQLAEAFSWGEPEDFPADELAKLGALAAQAFFQPKRTRVVKPV